MSGLFGAIAGGFERKAVGERFGSVEQIWTDLFDGRPAKSGVSVNANTAFQCTAILACARRIAEALMVPCKVYQRDPQSTKREERRQHPLFRVFDYRPNQWQSGIEYRETIGLQLALTFNHYSYISRVRGQVDELIPLSDCRPEVQNDGSLKYRAQVLPGRYTLFDADEIWHIRGPSWDGRVGMDGLKLIREAVGLALATEETHARLFSNGAQPGGILTTEKELTKAARERLKAQWGAYQVGLANRFRTAVLDSGLKFEPMAMSGVDAQHIEVRRFQVEEICRAMCVMPIMIGAGDKTQSYASSEQMFLAHLVHTVRPWHDRVAGSAVRWLFTPTEWSEGLYLAFTEEAFLSPAMKDKAEYRKIALGGGGNPGWMTPNEARAHDEMPPITGGDRLYVPVNSTPIGDDGFPRPVARQPQPSNPSGE